MIEQGLDCHLYSLCIANLLRGVQSALRLKPTFTDAYNNMASALVQKGLIPAALQCYQTALAVNPNLVGDSESTKYQGLRRQKVWRG
jgi:tetratricopeptide (TPR) repeat protein